MKNAILLIYKNDKYEYKQVEWLALEHVLWQRDTLFVPISMITSKLMFSINSCIVENMRCFFFFTDEMVEVITCLHD